jgi:hypothetical protein
LAFAPAENPADGRHRRFQPPKTLLTGVIAVRARRKAQMRALAAERALLGRPIKLPIGALGLLGGQQGQVKGLERAPLDQA